MLKALSHALHHFASAHLLELKLSLLVSDCCRFVFCCFCWISAIWEMIHK